MVEAGADLRAGAGVEILPASWRDFGALKRLEQICFPKDAWPVWDLMGVLIMPDVIRLKAVAVGEMVGFIAGDVRRSQRVTLIATIGVLPEYRRRGVGAALLAACESRALQGVIRLNVRQTNRAAIRLYRGFGYEEVGIWPNYYQDGEDALIMEKQKWA
jgi:ribosomal-protein-alanine N-acetyltransferase